MIIFQEGEILDEKGRSSWVSGKHFCAQSWWHVETQHEKWLSGSCAPRQWMGIRGRPWRSWEKCHKRDTKCVIFMYHWVLFSDQNRAVPLLLTKQYSVDGGFQGPLRTFPKVDSEMPAPLGLPAWAMTSCHGMFIVESVWRKARVLIGTPTHLGQTWNHSAEPSALCLVQCLSSRGSWMDESPAEIASVWVTEWLCVCCADCVGWCVEGRPGRPGFSPMLLLHGSVTPAQISLSSAHLSLVKWGQWSHLSCSSGCCFH